MPPSVLSNSVSYRQYSENALAGRSCNGENRQTCGAPQPASNLIHSKRLKATVTPVESILTGCPHLHQNTPLQVVYNQHLRVFSFQPLWIQHLREITGGGVSAFRWTPGAAWPAAFPKTRFRTGDSQRIVPPSCAKSAADRAALIGGASAIPNHLGSRTWETIGPLLTSQIMGTHFRRLGVHCLHMGAGSTWSLPNRSTEERCISARA